MKITLVIEGTEEGVSLSFQTILKNTTANLSFHRETVWFGLTKSEKTKVLNYIQIIKFCRNKGSPPLYHARTLESYNISYQSRG